MDNFDIIYYINLEHRTDRKEHIISELSKFPNLNVVRVNGIYDPINGAIGCSKSHILALEHFVNTGYEKCLILEDDFEFTQTSEYVNNILSQFFREVPNYDVLMLSGNTLSEINTYNSIVTKIIDSQTASGYSVHRNFGRILLDNFKEGLFYLESTNINHEYSIDIYWKRLQPISNWYCLKPKIGKQMKSYSDTCYQLIDHGV